MVNDDVIDILKDVEKAIDKKKQEVTTLMLSVYEGKEVATFLNDLRELLSYTDLIVISTYDMIRLRSVGHQEEDDQEEVSQVILKDELDKIESKILYYAGKQGYENPDIIRVVFNTIGDAI